MSLLHLCQSEDGIWLHVTPGAGPVAAINLLAGRSPHAGIVRRALNAALAEQPCVPLTHVDLLKHIREEIEDLTGSSTCEGGPDLRYLVEKIDAALLGLPPVLPAMPTKKAYYTGTSINSFRPGCRALILGIFFVTPPGSEPRPCFALRYEDGIMDFSPVSDISNYQLFSE